MDPDGIDALHSLSEKIDEFMELMKEIAKAIVNERSKW